MPLININGIPLFYTDTHPPHATSTSASPPKLTALLIHGLGSSSNFYQPIIPLISRHARCISIDTPGSGLSSLPSTNDGQVTIESIAETAVALLDELKVDEKVVLIGHSMGGMVSNMIASRYTERVLGVLLLGPVNSSEALKEVFEGRKATVAKEGIEPIASSLPLTAPSPTATPFSRAFVRTLILSITAKGYIALCNALIHVSPVGTSSFPLKHVSVPLRILVGEHDRTAPRKMAEEILDAYGTGEGEKRIVEVKGVGHWYCVERWEEVGGLVNEFLEGL